MDDYGNQDLPKQTLIRGMMYRHDGTGCSVWDGLAFLRAHLGRHCWMVLHFQNRHVGPVDATEVREQSLDTSILIRRHDPETVVSHTNPLCRHSSLDLGRCL
jgi:hypothetical protein